MARIAPAKPNYNPRQFANTTFVDGEGWILTDPESGRTECLVSVSGTGWTVAGEEVEEEEEEEAE